MIDFSVKEVESRWPGVMIIYSEPKLGKSTIMADLTLKSQEIFGGHAFVISTDVPNGYRFLSYVGEHCKNPSEFNKTITELIDLPQEQKPKCVIVDTITALDDWSEPLGTLRYMNSPQGKKFNVVVDDNDNVLVGPDGKPLRYSPRDPSFQSVHELPEGRGYAHSRKVMKEWFERLTAAFEHVILVAHVKDIYIGVYRGEGIQGSDLDLTGKVKRIYVSRADSIAMLVPEGDNRYLSFASKNKGSLHEGARTSYLSGKRILISEKKDDDTIITNWKNIFA